MPNVTLAPDVYCVGVNDPGLTVFDIVIPTEYGTTYNSYLVKGKEKTALIDCVKRPFVGEFFRKIEEILPVEKIDYVIVNHSEPDHAGGIVDLLQRHPNVAGLLLPPRQVVRRQPRQRGVQVPHRERQRGTSPRRQDAPVHQRAVPSLARHDLHVRGGRQDPLSLRLPRLPLFVPPYLQRRARRSPKRPAGPSSSTTARSCARTRSTSSRRASG